MLLIWIFLYVVDRHVGNLGLGQARISGLNRVGIKSIDFIKYAQKIAYDK